LLLLIFEHIRQLSRQLILPPAISVFLIQNLILTKIAIFTENR